MRFGLLFAVHNLGHFVGQGLLSGTTQGLQLPVVGNLLGGAGNLSLGGLLPKLDINVGCAEANVGGNADSFLAESVGGRAERVRRVLTADPGMGVVRHADAGYPDMLSFKRDVRRLKELGLTESLEVGYRLSPRGEAATRAR